MNDIEKQELLDTLALKIIRGDNLVKIQAELPTDITNWKYVFRWIHSNFYFELEARTTSTKNLNIPHETALAVILWIENLLKNPFELTAIISSKDNLQLKIFLNFYLKNLTNWTYKKISIRCLSFLAYQLKDYEANCFINTENKCFLYGETVADVVFYCFYKNLSKLTVVNRSITAMLDNDSITVKRYKIKILSFISDRYSVKADIQYLITMINIDNCKMGWTISKAIYYMSRLLCKESLIDDLKQLLKSHIFADEQCWINTLCILSFLALEGEDIGNIEFIEEVFLYENEFYCKSALLKETAIFFIWTLVRSSKDIAPLINRIVYTALFDIDYICRRAAACVIQELLGRSKEFYNKDNTFVKIPESVKRRVKNIDVFEQLECKEEYFKYLENSLYSYDRESREIAAILLGKYMSLSAMKICYTKVIEMDGTHLLINHFIENKEDKPCNEFLPFMLKFILNNQNYTKRNMKWACKSYLKIIKYFPDLKSVRENILFLILKNFEPTELYKSTKECFSNDDFCKKVLKLFNKNSSSILINSNNEKYKDEVVEKTLDNIKQKRMIDVSVLTLQLINEFSQQTQLIIFELLHDYTVSYNGDIGYFNRRAALEYFSSIEDLGSVISIENYLIRFLSDKSKKLREDVLKALLFEEYVQYQKYFPFVSYDGIKLKKKHVCKNNYLNTFFHLFSQLTSTLEYEEAYFKAMFQAFVDCEDFYIGIGHTFENASSTLSAVIKNEIINLNRSLLSNIKDDGSNKKLIRYIQELDK